MPDNPLVTKRTPATLQELQTLCETLYTRDGFVKWAEVADILGVTRQAVFNRLNKAVEQGHLTKDDVNRWRSMSSRHAQSRKNLELKREHEKLRIAATLTPENKQWLMQQSVLHRATTSDVINGLITKARTGQ
jgi:MarR-like DNA-binding transcriptional regulator SgrR of sgrS sRNA